MEARVFTRFNLVMSGKMALNFLTYLVIGLVCI